MVIEGAADWSCTPLATVLGDGISTGSTRAFGMHERQVLAWPGLIA